MLLQNFIDHEESNTLVIDINNEFSQVGIPGLEGKSLEYIFPSMPLVMTNSSFDGSFD